MIGVAAGRIAARRGFTLIEVLLTLLISSMILTTVSAIFAMMARANNDLGARYEDLGELSRAHGAIRLAMQSLVSGQPVSDLLSDDDNTTPAAGANADRPTNAEIRERLDISDDDLEPLHFILEASTEAAQQGVIADDKAPRRLEVVMERQPTPQAPANNGRPVRGAFEPVYLSGAGAYTRWALDYKPIQPSGESIRLIDDAALIDWTVLGHAADSEVGERMFGLFEALEAKDYPMAIRLVVITWDNTRVDWIFEPGVTVGDE
jgi:prepilin-type N-terminal cleavage/methylation domain-containing protein